MKNNLLQQKRKLQEGEMIRLSYDEAFKIIYANPKNIQILAMLISRYWM